MAFTEGNRDDGKHYWLTPPDLMRALEDEFHFDFDPCPFPKPDDFEGLDAEWGRSNWVNPPFGVVMHQGKKKGPTAWVRKAIEEFKKGKKVVLVYPMDKWMLMLIQAGAKIRNLYDVKWCATEDGTPGKGTGRHIAMFILDPAQQGEGHLYQKEGTQTMCYDSTGDVRDHQERVHRNIHLVMGNLLERAFNHDQSKLHEPEKEVFDQFTPRLTNVKYGTPQYRETLREMQPALDHHYAENCHHPEHFLCGVNDMSLIDIIEMLCDWKAAADRQGNLILDSSEINAKRFNISEQLTNILLTTASQLWPEVLE